ncbi:MAG: hypothetical protein RL516_1618 [Bacteroidota bacterium]|jgi:hypothetical protein
MNQADIIRNEIIDKLLTISDKDYLAALSQIVDSVVVKEGKIKLTEEQKIMLQMSEEDYNEGRILSQENLDQSDFEWLKGK